MMVNPIFAIYTLHKIYHAYLEILVSELVIPFSTSLVDDLSNSNDFTIIVADRHADQ